MNHFWCHRRSTIGNQSVTLLSKVSITVLIMDSRGSSNFDAVVWFIVACLTCHYFLRGATTRWHAQHNLFKHCEHSLAAHFTAALNQFCRNERFFPEYYLLFSEFDSIHFLSIVFTMWWYLCLIVLFTLFLWYIFQFTMPYNSKVCSHCSPQNACWCVRPVHVPPSHSQFPFPSTGSIQRCTHQQIPSRVRLSGPQRPVLRQHKHHKECPW